MDPIRYTRPHVRRLKAYEAKEIPCRFKLDANESPLGLPDEDRHRICRALDRVELNRYPDPDARDLRRVLARGLRVSQKALLLGNGSDELISMLITTFGGPVLFPTPTFAMYGIIGQGLGVETIGVPLDRDFDLDLDRMLETIRRRKPRLVFLSSPNNPTGNRFSRERLIAVLARTRGIAVVDEAYQPFAGGRGVLSLLRKTPNLVVLRTLSKIGLASLRLGMMVASPELTAEVNKVRLPFNVSTLSQVCATELLGHDGAVEKIVGKVISERDRLFRALSAVPGVRTHPSEANFILFRVDDGDRVFRGLLRKGILVRNLNTVVPNALRVTVGLPAENRAFLKALKAVVR